MEIEEQIKTYTYDEVYKTSLEYFKGDELATNVFISKYCLKSKNGDYLESNPDDMHHRMAKEFARVSTLSENEIYELFKDFKYIIPQGSVMYGCGNNEQTISLSNCFVVGQPKDQYSSIILKDLELASIYKRRGGAGIDISTLRPRGTIVNNAAGSSTGAVSFMERYSNTTREAAQNGRRGALMITLDVRHPDIEEFIKIKQDLTKVTGANISILLHDDFMKAAENDEDYILRFPCTSDDAEDYVNDLRINGNEFDKEVFDFERDIPYNKLQILKGNQSNPGDIYFKRIKAKELWNKIIKAAHTSAEPGLIFKDKQDNYSPSHIIKGFENVTTNPCCLLGNTLVKTKIGDIFIEDLVGKNITIHDGEQWITCNSFDFKGVVDKIYYIYFSENDKIGCTFNHRWFQDDKEILTEKLSIWDEIDCINVNTGYKYKKKIEKIEIINGLFPVYCPSIQTTSKFVLNNGLITGNSEIMMGEFDSCRLMCINMFNFVDNPFEENSTFNMNKWYDICYKAMELSDGLVDLELEKVEQIINKIKSDDIYDKNELNLWEQVYKIGKNGRRTGLGITGLGDAIATLGYKYDSEQALSIVDKIMETKLIAELDASCDMSSRKGCYPAFNYKAIQEDFQKHGSFFNFIRESNPAMESIILNKGLRNISWSTVAPTGSLSILAQTSSGIEPLFQPFYIRRKKINPADTNTRIDFTDKMGDKWQEYPVLHPKFIDWCISKNSGNTKKFLETLDKKTLQGLFELSPWYKSTANDIDWMKRIEMQSIIQKYTTHSISSTINLPEDVSVNTVSKIYFESWNKGLKGITIYRDKCRDGVLVSQKDTKSATEFIYNNAPKRPKDLPCDIHTTKVKGINYNVIVGLFDGLPYEVFAISEGETLKGKGHLEKVSKKKYRVVNEDKSDIIIKDIIKEMSSEEEAITRLLSISLRHGANIQFIVEQLNKTSGSLVNFDKAIARILKSYIPEEQLISRAKCTDCGSNNLKFENGCSACLDCGSSKCG